jgi:glycosyltransferase involved in cell wall biosynthesis
MMTPIPFQRIRIRILILINVRWWNATAFYAVNIARLLNQNGHRVWVGCDPAYPAYRVAQAYGLPVAPLAFYGGNPLKLVRSFRALVQLIRAEGIEIINSHRSEDHSFALLAKLLCGTRLVVTRGDQRRVQNHLLSRLRYQLADAVILTCRQLYTDNEAVFHRMRRRVRIIHGSVDEDHFRPQAAAKQTRAKYGLPEDKLIVAMIGRLSRVKDQSRFVQAAIALAQARDDLHFLVAGKEVDLGHADLRRRVAAGGVSSRFTFLSTVDDIADLMNLVDVGVILSVASETISRVLLEFMYLGKAVVATDVNAIGEIVVPGLTGERIPAGDSRALVCALLKLAAHPRLRETYARNAARVYADTYSQGAFYRRYAEVLTPLDRGGPP